MNWAIWVRETSKLGGTFKASFAGQVSSRKIATNIIEEGLKLKPGPLTFIPEDATFLDYYWGGDDTAAAALDALLRPINRTWYEQDGLVRINAPGKAQSDAPTISVNQQIGMIETPIVTDEGAEIRVFLNARIVLGCILDIESLTVNGRWKVVGTQTIADNWVGKFETFCDLREVV